jgi:EmrB/QacA subfamily drug resistance transporter
VAQEPDAQNSSTALSAQRERFRAAFIAVAPSMFLGSLDQTIVAAALPVIALAFGGLSLASWVVTAYLLAATVAAPIYGRLGDAFGRKRILVWSLALFLLGSIACSVAPTISLLIAGRCLQGFGGGGLMTLSQALIGEVVSSKERGRFQGWFGAVFALASTVGPAAGGILTQHLGWRSVFWINAPLCTLAAAMAFRLNAARGTGNYKTDLKGITLFVLGSLALLLCLTSGGQQLHSEPWLPVSLLVASALCFLAFCWVERRSDDPLLAPKVVENTLVWRTGLSVFLFAAGLFGLIVQFPLFLQVRFGVSTSLSGLLLIPLTIAQVAVSTLTGLNISRTGAPRKPLLWGLVLAALAFGGLAFSLQRGNWLVAFLVLLVGAGLGSPMPAGQTIVQWAVETDQLGEATAFVSFARSVGGVFGAAVTSAVLVAAGTGTTSFRFGMMFATLGFLTLVGALITATLPEIDLGQKKTQ